MPLCIKFKTIVLPMNKITTNYFLITQNGKAQINNLIEDELEFERMSKELEALVFEDEPSDMVISRILQFVTNEL
jgi:hypothetical protein